MKMKISNLFEPTWEVNDNLKMKWRQNLIAGASLLGIPATLASLSIRFFTSPDYHSFDWVGLFVIIALGLNLFLSRSLRGIKIASCILCAIPLVALPVSAWNSGGLRSPVVLWFAIFPLIPSFLLGPRSGVIATLLVNCEIVALLLAHRLDVIPPASGLTGSSLFELFLTISLCSIVTYIFAAFYGRQSDRANAAIVEMSGMLSLGRMAGGVAHEINNPLAVIHGNLSLLKHHQEAGTLDPDFLRDKLDKTNLVVMRIASIVQKLRSFAHRDPGLADTGANLKETLENALLMVGERLTGAGIELKNNLGAEISVNCQPDDLLQVLMTLLDNAEYAVKESIIKWIELSIVASPKGQVCFACTDSGPRITEKDAQQIMKPFFSTKPIGQGTGLGLSVASSLLARYGGKIWLDRQHSNTRFVVQLPENRKSKLAP